LNGADPATFTVLSAKEVEAGSYINSFAKDKNHVYVDCMVIPDADPSSFVLVGNHAIHDAAYAKDQRHVYFYAASCDSTCDPATSTSDLVEIFDADAATFGPVDKYVLQPGSGGIAPPTYYTKDKQHLYDSAEIIPGADPATTALDCSDADESGELVCATQSSSK
jgi:hypothetical protein